QEIRARQTHLDGFLRHGLCELDLRNSQWVSSSQGPKDCGVADFSGRYIECLKLFVELFRIINVGQKVSDRDQLTVLQNATDKGCVVIAPLFTVRDHIDPGAFLRGYSQLHGVVRVGLEIGCAESAFEVLME